MTLAEPIPARAVAPTIVVDRNGHRPAAPTTEPSVSPSRAGIPHFSALEGLRGLAVVGVVLFHARFSWMRGGFLGVSTFFTLSGFLITSLLLTERGSTGAIDLRRFWLRRFRRLMPASLAALALVVAYGALAADAVQRRNLAGDVLASLGYVANWRFLLAEQAYADIFGEASPVAHFWSLAIEEQFYLLMPLVAWFLLARRNVGRGLFAAVLAVLAAVSLALGFFGGLSGDAAYFNTGTRAVELLAGAILATAVFDRRVTVPLGRDRRVQVLVSIAGVACLALMVWLWTAAEQSGENGRWLYRGGLPAYSVLSAVVILAAITPAGPIRWLLSLWPLRALGMISYGVYLYHWPIFLWLDGSRLPGWSDGAVFAVRAAVTLAVAVLSYKLIETPIRRRSSARGRRPVWPVAPVVIAGLAVAVVAVTLNAPKPLDFDAAEAELAAMRPSGPPPPPPEEAGPEPPFPRVAFFGDSTAFFTQIGFGRWTKTSGQAEFVTGVQNKGCGIARGGELRMAANGEAVKLVDGCNRWAFDYHQAIENGQPNIAVVQSAAWELIDRRLEGGTRWTNIGDPEFDAYLLSEMSAMVDVLSARGAVVVWLTAPPQGHPDDGKPKVYNRDPARAKRYNELVNQLPAARPGKVAVVDLGAWVAARTDDDRLRPDGGFHFTEDTAEEVSQTFLGPEVLKAFRETWKQRAKLGADATAPVDPAAVDDSGRYLIRYKAVVVGDQTSAPLADAIVDWGRRSGSLDVSTSLSPNCGIIDSVVREDRGEPATTPAACRPPAAGAVSTVGKSKPDFVIVLPSPWDTAGQRLTANGAYSTWTDPAFAKAATAQLKARTEAFNKSGSVVLWVNPPRLTPAVPASLVPVLGAVEPARADRASQAMQELADTVARHGAQRIDLAGWMEKGLPAPRPGTDADTATLTAIAAWIGGQTYTQYDRGDKLKPAPKPGK